MFSFFFSHLLFLLWKDISKISALKFWLICTTPSMQSILLQSFHWTHIRLVFSLNIFLKNKKFRKLSFVAVNNQKLLHCKELFLWEQDFLHPTFPSKLLCVPHQEKLVMYEWFLFNFFENKIDFNIIFKIVYYLFLIFEIRKTNHDNL